MFKRLILGSALFSHCLIANPIPDAYIDLETFFPFDGDGWFSNGPHLESCFREQKIKTVIEIGSWLGLSTRFLATLVAEGGTVYAIDTWKGSVDEEIHQRDPRLPYLYEMFLSNVIHANLMHVIVPIRSESLEAAKTWDIKADLIYIDASHGTEAVYQDIINWFPHLNEGGILCGDDFCWPTVAEGVRKAALELNLEIVSDYTWWRLKKPY